MNGRQTIIDMIGNVAKWVLIVVLILFFVKQANRFYQIGYSVFSPTSMDASGSGKEVTVDITKDMSVRDIGKLLQKDELIANGTVFYYQEMFSVYHGKIQPGEYTLRSDMLPEEMLEVMSGGADTASTGVSAGAAEDAGSAASGASIVNNDAVLTGTADGTGN